MRYLLLVFMLIAITIPAWSNSNEGQPLVVGETITLDSEIMGEKRTIWISHPVNGQKAKTTNHANTAIYQQNYERLKTRLADAGK